MCVAEKFLLSFLGSPNLWPFEQCPKQTVVLSIESSTTKETIGNSPVRHGWVAPSPVNSQNDMEKYGKPIDHCCPFGSKWSAWKCEVFQFCGCENLLDYLNMEFIYLWMIIYIYIWFIEDLQIIYRWFCSRLLQLYPCPAWRQVASPWPTSCRRAPGLRAALEVDWLRDPWKNKIRNLEEFHTLNHVCPQKLRSKNRNCIARCLEFLLGFIPSFSVCGMDSPRVAFTQEKYPWQTNKITSGPTQPWVGLRCSQKGDQQILWTMLEGGSDGLMHALTSPRAWNRPNLPQKLQNPSEKPPETVAKRLFCPTTMGRKKTWFRHV